MMLELKQVTVKLSGFTILRDLTLEVPEGRIVGLIGRNGAGKTTTLRAIMGLVKTESGQVVLEGRDLSQLEAHQRAPYGLGYLPQERRLIPQLSVEQNIMLPVWAMTIKDAQERLKVIYDLMPEVQQFRSRPASSLSGGQQKLAALARAFMSGSRLLLLDEPFEGVAPALSQRLLTAVIELQQAQAGLSVLVCESDFKWVRRLAQIVYVIERGEATLEVTPATAPSARGEPRRPGQM
jgi:branched-chain amino acid transport system ATP-binding protein